MPRPCRRSTPSPSARDEYPDRSTTLVIEVDVPRGGTRRARCRGPGIDGAARLAVDRAAGDGFWAERATLPQPAAARPRHRADPRRPPRRAAALDARRSPEGDAHVCRGQGRREGDHGGARAARRGAARRPRGPRAQPCPDRAAARPCRRPGDDRGLDLRPRARRAGDQAGARRSGRGDLPAARLSHDPAAPCRDRCRSTPARPALRRRISATFKDVPGGQMLGPTFDYTHRLLDFALAAEAQADGRSRASAATAAETATRRPCRASPICSAARG